MRLTLAPTLQSLPHADWLFGRELPDLGATIASNGTAATVTVPPGYTLPASQGVSIAGAAFTLLSNGALSEDVGGAWAALMSNLTHFVGEDDRKVYAPVQIIDGQSATITGRLVLRVTAANPGLITIASDAIGTLATLTAPTGYVFTSQAVIITIPAANNGTVQTVACTLYSNGDLIEDTPGEFAADLILSGQTGNLSIVLSNIQIIPFVPGIYVARSGAVIITSAGAALSYKELP